MPRADLSNDREAVDQISPGKRWRKLSFAAIWTCSRHLGHVDRETLKSPRKALYGNVIPGRSALADFALQIWFR
jgi:hypothetical protein